MSKTTTQQNDWQEVKLGEIGNIVTGKTPSKKNPEDWGNDFDFITPTDIVGDSKYLTNVSRQISKTGSDRFSQLLIPPNTVIVTCIGSDMGKVVLNKRTALTNQQIKSLIVSKKVHHHFAYYALKNKHKVLRQHAESGGSTMPILNKTNFSNLKILLPPLPEQKAIAEVLSSLDDKIDLLHRQNKTLEDTAQALFRKWFIDESDEGWEVGKLGDVLEAIESGSRPKGGIDPNLKTGIPSIGAESIDGIGNFNFSKVKYVSFEYFEKMKRGIVNDYDVLIYKDGAYIGKKAMFGLGFPFKNFAVNEHVFILRGNSKINQFFLYFLLEQQELAKLNANSAQPGLNQQAMKSFEIIIPPKKIIDKFGDIVQPWVEKILFNSSQIRTLENLRDTLLPKLMSGEIIINCKL